MQYLKNIWNNCIKYFLAGCVFGAVIDLLLLAAFNLSKMHQSSKFVDVAAVVIGTILLMFKKKINKEWHDTLEYTAVMAPGGILLVEVFNKIMNG